MDTIRVIEAVMAVVGLIGLAFSIYFFMDARHASNRDIFEVKSEILDRDIKKDAEARVYYKDKEIAGTLDQADQRRLEYLEEQLDLKYEEQKIVREILLKK